MMTKDKNWTWLYPVQNWYYIQGPCPSLIWSMHVLCGVGSSYTEPSRVKGNTPHLLPLSWPLPLELHCMAAFSLFFISSFMLPALLNMLISYPLSSCGLIMLVFLLKLTLMFSSLLMQELVSTCSLSALTPVNSETAFLFISLFQQLRWFQEIDVKTPLSLFLSCSGFALWILYVLPIRSSDLWPIFSSVFPHELPPLT